MATDVIEVTSLNEAPGRILTIARKDFDEAIHSYVNEADKPAPKAEMKAAPKAEPKASVPIRTARATNHHNRKRA